MSQTEDTMDAPPTSSERWPRPRPSRHRAAALTAILVLVVLVGVVLADVALGGGGGNSGNGVVDNPYPTALQRVMRRSLSEQTQTSATLGYAAPSTIVVPAGTAPSALQQQEQQATTAQAQLATAQATLASDSQTLAQASLAALQAKVTVDCSGDNAGESSATSASGSGGSAAGPCATDSQSVTTEEQSLTQADAKVATDRQQVSTAQTGLTGAESALAQDESSAAFYGQSSTYTALPAVGKIVKRGQTLYEVSGQPVVLLYGPVGAWRAFRSAMTPGRDVAELNANLDTLGFGKGLTGETFTAATATAIDAFQRAHGLTQTGGLLLASLVFEPGPVRVTAVTPTLGATVQTGPVLSITSTIRQVTIQLDAAQQSSVKVGDPVTITLPDNSTTPGRISYVGTVATTPSSSDQGGGGSTTPTIEVDVTPTDPAVTGHLDQAPVNVSITTGSVNNALVVPVNALLALANGGYAVEEPGTGGVNHLVAVQLGLFDDADGLVQVTGSGLAAGQRVVVPSA
jgi:Putative peptidoglycan binding domain